VAQCQLPFSFNVVPKLPTTWGKRKRTQVEQTDPPAPDTRTVRRRMDDANVLTSLTRDEQVHHPADHQDASEDVQPCEDIKPSSPTLVPSLDSRRSAGSSSARLEVFKPTNQAIAPPRTDGECGPILMGMNPRSGSFTGGAEIWLQGADFPTHFRLFARFGTAVVPTAVSSLITCEVLSNRPSQALSNNTLVCTLPPAAAGGVVEVTLSKYPEPNAPKYGTSIVMFHYLSEYEQL